MEIKRHKVFVSYYHDDDQDYKNQIIDWEYWDDEKFERKSIFDDYSVGDGDIDDKYLTDEQIRRKIRDEYIKDATVLILLCGKNTKTRKHIDWEIHTAMYHSDVNPQMGIIVVNLPSINQTIRVSQEDEKEIISDNDGWISLDTRNQFEKYYPYMPERIIDNFVKKIPITVVDWDVINENHDKLMILIDNAYKRRNSFRYDHSRPLRKSNSTDMVRNK